MIKGEHYSFDYLTKGDNEMVRVSGVLVDNSKNNRSNENILTILLDELYKGRPYMACDRSRITA